MMSNRLAALWRTMPPPSHPSDQCSGCSNAQAQLRATSQYGETIDRSRSLTRSHLDAFQRPAAGSASLYSTPRGAEPVHLGRGTLSRLDCHPLGGASRGHLATLTLIRLVSSHQISALPTAHGDGGVALWVERDRREHTGVD